jgi:hypothetical protein
MEYKRFQNGIQTVPKWYTKRMQKESKKKKNAKRIHKKKNVQNP